MRKFSCLNLSLIYVFVYNLEIIVTALTLVFWKILKGYKRNNLLGGGTAHFYLLLFIFKDFFKICICFMCMSIFLYCIYFTCVPDVKVRRGCWVPWSWSCRWAAWQGCWELNPHKSIIHSYCWVVSNTFFGRMRKNQLRPGLLYILAS